MDKIIDAILDKYGGNWDDAEEVEKLIRQQIGRELLEEIGGNNWVHQDTMSGMVIRFRKITREVCKLEEE